MDSQITYDIELKFDSKDDWNEIKGMLENWEYRRHKYYKGAEAPFSMKAYKSETYANKWGV